MDEIQIYLRHEPVNEDGYHYDTYYGIGEPVFFWEMCWDERGPDPLPDTGLYSGEFRARNFEDAKTKLKDIFQKLCPGYEIWIDSDDRPAYPLSS